jgi:hypothetical protein
LAFEFFVLRFAIGQPDFTVVMLTLGLAAVLQISASAPGYLQQIQPYFESSAAKDMTFAGS